MQRRTVLITVAATLAAVALAAGLLAAAVVYSGVYSVAATKQHFQPVFSLLETAMHRSVRLHARDIEAPPPADEATVLRGAACFRDMCVQCHGAPGVAQEEIGKSMQPLPGPLVDAAKHWKPRELYWITRHGIRMSGMPSWNLRLTEPELWAVVAFMLRLPDLEPAQYAQLTAQGPPAPACGRGLPGAVLPALTAADPARGRNALFQYACSSCHTIPGVAGAFPLVGPSLKGIAGRALIAGKLPNNADNLVLWLTRTQQVKPGTAMPDMGVTQQDARDMAAYLATLH